MKRVSWGAPYCMRINGKNRILRINGRTDDDAIIYRVSARATMWRLSCKTPETILDLGLYPSLRKAFDAARDDHNLCEGE